MDFRTRSVRRIALVNTLEVRGGGYIYLCPGQCWRNVLSGGEFCVRVLALKPLFCYICVCRATWELVTAVPSKTGVPCHGVMVFRPYQAVAVVL